MSAAVLRLGAVAAAIVAVALPASAQAANLVPNGSFSQPCPGATCDWITPLETTISQDTSTFATAPASLKVEYNGAGSPSGAADAFSSCIPVTAGTRYLLSYNYRFSTAAHVEFVGAAAQFFTTACAGSPIVSDSVGGLGTTTGDNQWREIVGSMTAPAGATHVFIQIGVACDAFPCRIGTFANFDEVVFDVVGTTAARFRSLSAVATAVGTSIRWRTASEMNVAGFNVYRSWHGRRVRLNARLIPAANAARGHAYRYLDRGAARAGARYSIQAVNLDASVNWYGPASI